MYVCIRLEPKFLKYKKIYLKKNNKITLRNYDYASTLIYCQFFFFKPDLVKQLNNSVLTNTQPTKKYIFFSLTLFLCNILDLINISSNHNNNYNKLNLLGQQTNLIWVVWKSRNIKKMFINFYFYKYNIFFTFDFLCL